jgi:hypothetical protein
VVDPKKIDANPKLVLIKPLQEADKPIPREALQELMSFISHADFIGNSQPKSGDEKLRAKNLDRDKARELTNF